MKGFKGILVAILSVLLNLFNVASAQASTHLPKIEAYKTLSVAGSTVYIAFTDANALSSECIPGEQINLEVTVDQEQTYSTPLALKSIVPDTVLSPTIGVEPKAIGQRVVSRGLASEPAADGREVAVVRSTYPVILNVLSNAEPRRYYLRLLFEEVTPPLSPALDIKTDQSDAPNCEFNIPVGLAQNDLITIQSRKNPAVIHAGGQATPLEVTVTNPFTDYDMTIKGWSVEDDSGLIQRLDYDPQKDTGRGKANPPLVIPRRRSKTFNIPVYGSVLGGLVNLNSDPKLTVTLFYSDGERIGMDTQPPRDVIFKLDPGVGIALMCAIFGLFVGGIVRWGALAKANAASFKGIAFTFWENLLALGIVFTLAWIFDIQVFSIRNSAVASASTPQSALVLGLVLGVSQPRSIFQTIQGKILDYIKNVKSKTQPEGT